MKRRDSLNGKAANRILQHLATNPTATRRATAQATGASVGRVGEVVRALEDLDMTARAWLLEREAICWQEVARGALGSDEAQSRFEQLCQGFRVVFTVRGTDGRGTVYRVGRR